MTNFDIDNGEELQPYKDYNYDLIEKNYPTEENTPSSTYNQFIQLRDTLVHSGKKYDGKGGCRLIVGEEEETIEIDYGNIYKMSFSNINDSTPTIDIKGPYVELSETYGKIGCVIKKDGRYKIIHKEEVLPNANQTKVYCYVDLIRNGQYVVIGGIAVFDWVSNGTLSGTASVGGDSGSCSVSFTLGKLFQKMTAFGYIERDLKAGDILVLRTKDSDVNADGSPNGNDLVLQPNSNFFSVEYINLPYNN